VKNSEAKPQSLAKPLRIEELLCTIRTLAVRGPDWDLARLGKACTPGPPTAAEPRE
jgi:hypothetical protein